MKKLVLSLIAVMAMTTAMAQDNNGNQNRRRNFDPKEMVQRRTQEIVEKYNLTAEQAEKLKALNEKYLGQSRGPRGGERPDGQTAATAPQQKPEKEAKEGRENRQRDNRGGMNRGGQGRGNGMRARMEEYNKELKSILTEDQLKAYEADQAKRMEQMRQRRQN